MNTRTHCICSAPLIRKPFSPNFDALGCNECGSSHFVSTENGLPPPEFKYDSDNGKYAQDDYLFGKQLRWAHHELLKQNWIGRKVLEIGCFNGFFLDELRNAGADVYGFDVNENAISVGKEMFGFGDRLNDSMEILAKQGPFDDVLCIDVLEHLDWPENSLDEIIAMLRPNGRVIVAGPTIERGFRDKSDYPPHHKWWFSRSGLELCLQLKGFGISSVAIQHDGLLFLRNFLGKALHGLDKKEFYGETKVEAPQFNSPTSSFLYAMAAKVGISLFTVLRISYCSTILIGTKGTPK